jgi:hypothetical protein
MADRWADHWDFYWAELLVDLKAVMKAGLWAALMGCPLAEYWVGSLAGLLAVRLANQTAGW